jgi:hypothetical protein
MDGLLHEIRSADVDLAERLRAVLTELTESPHLTDTL